MYACMYVCLVFEDLQKRGFSDLRLSPICILHHKQRGFANIPA